MANYIKLIPLEIIINRVKNLIKYATPILGEDKIKMNSDRLFKWIRGIL